MTTSPVTTTEYWNAAPHPQLAHLPQLPHPLNNKVVTVQATTAKKLPTTHTTKIGKNSTLNSHLPLIFMRYIYLMYAHPNYVILNRFNLLPMRLKLKKDSFAFEKKNIFKNILLKVKSLLLRIEFSNSKTFGW